MKRDNFLIVFIFAIGFCSGVSAQGAGNKNSLLVKKTGKSTLVVDPTFGARVISLKYNDIEFLYGGYNNPESSGSTFWPAPQKIWEWPPIDTLDSKLYSMEMDGKTQKFISMPSRKSGFQFYKTFKVNPTDSSFVMEYTIKNISNSVKDVGCWEVSRVFPGGVTFFPAAPDSAILKQSKLPGVTLINGIVYFNYDYNQITENTKLFAMGSEGWYAHVKNGIAFIKTFEDLPSNVIAPQQAEIEIYANGNPRYVELENHGRYATLKPNETVKYNVKWYLRTVPKQLQQTEQRTDLVNWVRKQIVHNVK